MDQKVDNFNGLFKCNTCNKDYSSYKSLWNHNKKFHNNNVVICGSVGGENVVKSGCTRGDNVVEVKNNNNQHKYNCKFCSKKFNDRSNKHKHEKTCKNKINLEEENKKLKEEIILLENNQLVPVTNTNTNNEIINKYYC